MSYNLQNVVKFQKFQLENLVDFEKCCKTHIFLQKSVPIQPKTSNILPKFCQKLATTSTVGPGPGSASVAPAARGQGVPLSLRRLRNGALAAVVLPHGRHLGCK